MATLEELNVKINADIRGLLQGVQQTNAQLQGLTQTVNRSVTPAFTQLRGVFATVAGSVVVRQISELTKEMVGLAAVAETAGRRFDQVFGGAAEATRKQLAGLSDTVLLTRGEMERLAADMQDLLVPMGLSRGAAADMTTEMLELAAALSAATPGTTTEEAFRALTSAFIGETESAKRFGVVLGETEIKQEALRLGLIEQGEQLGKVERAQALYSAAMQQTADAQASFSNNLDTSERALAEVGREVRQLKEDVGSALLPALNILLQSLKDNRGALNLLTEDIVRAATRIGDIVIGIDTLVEKFQRLKDAIPPASVWNDFFEAVRNLPRYLVPGLRELDLLLTLLEKIGQEVRFVSEAKVQGTILGTVGRLGTLEGLRILDEDSAEEAGENAGGAAGAAFDKAFREEIAKHELEIRKAHIQLQLDAPDFQAQLDQQVSELGKLFDDFQAFEIPIPGADEAIAKLSELRAAFLGIEVAPTFEIPTLNVFQAGGGQIGSLVDDIIGFFGPLTQAADNAARELGTAVVDIARGTKSVLQGIGSVVVEFGRSLLDQIPVIGSFLNSLIDGIFGKSETAKNNQRIRESINETLREMQTLGTVDVGDLSRDLFSGFAISLKDAGLTTATAVRAVTDNFEFIAELIEDGVRGQALINEVLDKVREDLEGTADGIGDAGDRIADALSNVADGFKINLSRFNASITGVGPRSALPGAPGTATSLATVPTTSIGMQLNNSEIIIQANTQDDAETLLRKIESGIMNRQSKGGGGLQAAPLAAPIGRGG